MVYKTLTTVFGIGLMFSPMAGFAQENGEPTGTLRSVERVTGQIPEEVDAFRQMQDRFDERATEFREDVKQYFYQRKKEELSKVSTGYDALIQSLEAAERNQRIATIEKLTLFLDKYPEVDDADNIRFRLAELLYEESNEDWLEDQGSLLAKEDAYDALVEKAEAALDAGDPTLMEELPEPPEQPKKELAESIRLYDEIIAGNDLRPVADKWERLDLAFYSLGFLYRDTEVKQHSFDESQAAFIRLVSEHPESELADASHMFLGDLLFSEKKDFDGAIQQFQAVVDNGSDGPYYYDALFKLAWTFYKLAGRDVDNETRALELFTSMLDDSERRFMESGEASDYAPDARLNMARTLADIADRYEKNPVTVTSQYFSKIGERKWEREVYISLAEILGGCVPVPDPCPQGKGGRGRFEIEQAIDVYEKLQTDTRWLTHADNPAYQRKIIWLLPMKFDANVAVDRPEEQRKLVERYGEQLVDPMSGEAIPNPWWLANRNNPDALDQVRQFIEDSLGDVAIGLFSDAQLNNDPGLYAAAASKFREYLDKFPIADNYFEQQWLLANALLNASPDDPSQPWRLFEQAYQEFDSLYESRSGHPYGDGAVFNRFVALKKSLLSKEDMHGTLSQLPKSAIAERAYTTEFGKEVTVYKLHEDHQAFIDSMDVVSNHPFSEPKVATLANYKKVFSANKAYLIYTPGMILYYHNRYEEAREQLMKIFEDQDLIRTMEASYAAKLIVDSYTIEGDLASVRTYTSKFLRMPFPDEMLENLESKNKQSAFLQAEAFIQLGERGKAAAAFEQYMAEFPDTKQENYKFALYNAANNYEIVGQAEKANSLFERFVELYPSDEWSRKLFIRIAGNYESVFDLDRAIYFYKKLIQNDPKREFAGTSDAQYNMAFLQIGLGNARGAAKGFEEYVRLFPDAADVEDVYFRAGEQWEQVSKTEAQRFYERYIQKFGSQNPNHLMEARYRIAQLYKSQGKASAYRRAMDRVVSEFDNLTAAGVALQPASRSMAAERAFELLTDAYNTYATGEMIGNGDKDVALLEAKGQEVVEFEKMGMALLGKYKDFEYGLGAFYLMASAQMFVAELGYGMECPRSYSEEECDLWYEIMEESQYPLFDEYQEKAISRYKSLIEKAKMQELHSEWVDRAYEDLNRLDPFVYPAVKTEIRGGSDAQDYPAVLPLSVDLSEATE
jgi:TolA-binding protein